MAQQELVDRRGASLAPDELVRQEDCKALGAFRMAACRVQSR
jgi:hypothetical protein